MSQSVAKILSQITVKMTMFGQAALYIESESNYRKSNYCQKWQKFESSYCQKWQYLDKLSPI